MPTIRTLSGTTHEHAGAYPWPSSASFRHAIDQRVSVFPIQPWTTLAASHGRHEQRRCSSQAVRHPRSRPRNLARSSDGRLPKPCQIRRGRPSPWPRGSSPHRIRRPATGEGHKTLAGPSLWPVVGHRPKERNRKKKEGKKERKSREEERETRGKEDLAAFLRSGTASDPPAAPNIFSSAISTHFHFSLFLRCLSPSRLHGTRPSLLLSLQKPTPIPSAFSNSKLLSKVPAPLPSSSLSSTGELEPQILDLSSSEPI